MKCTRHRCQTLRELLGDRRLQPGIGIGDHQVHPGQATRPQSSQELAPEVEDSLSPTAVPRLRECFDRDPGRHHQRMRNDVGPDPHLAVGGVEEDIGKGGVGQRAFPKTRDLQIEPAQIRETCDLEIPDSTPSAATRSSTLRGHPVHVSLHDDRMQRLSIRRAARAGWGRTIQNAASESGLRHRRW